MCWANKLFIVMLFLLFLFTLLTGCGNKGKLYLPDENSKTTSSRTSSPDSSSVANR